MTIMRNADGPRTFVEGAERFRDVVIAASRRPAADRDDPLVAQLHAMELLGRVGGQQNRLLPLLEVEYAAILPGTRPVPGVPASIAPT